MLARGNIVTKSAGHAEKRTAWMAQGSMACLPGCCLYWQFQIRQRTFVNSSAVNLEFGGRLTRPLSTPWEYLGRTVDDCDGSAVVGF